MKSGEDTILQKQNIVNCLAKVSILVFVIIRLIANCLHAYNLASFAVIILRIINQQKVNRTFGRFNL